ncbi:MAG: hypothetical protein C4529_14215 [Deltaproteobacteria bacterium]|nr:MAG: hypothetical protein C4529_14215 [Deltaproteobacteria bacterium]
MQNRRCGSIGDPDWPSEHRKDMNTCTFCGQRIPGEPPASADPCEYCGSPAGGYLHSVVLPEAIGGPAAEFVEGATYPQILLRIARFLLDKDDDKLCGIATIVAHQACEVAVERSMSDAFARKGIRSLEESMADILNGYNLANDKVRNFHASLTGVRVREEPFWDAFVRSARRRDRIVRTGLVAGRTDAEESFAAARDLVAHLALTE